MTVSLAEATAAARRIRVDGYPVRGRKLQHVPQEFSDDASALAGFVLAGDTERLRTAIEKARERLYARSLDGKIEIEVRMGIAQAVKFIDAALAEGGV